MGDNRCQFIVCATKGGANNIHYLAKAAICLRKSGSQKRPCIRLRLRKRSGNLNGSCSETHRWSDQVATIEPIVADVLGDTLITSPGA